MTKTDRLEVRLEPALKARLEAHAAANPGTAAEHARAALVAYLDSPDSLVYAVEGPTGHTLRLFRSREKAARFTRDLGATIAPDGSWAVDPDDEPGYIRPLEIE